MAVHFAEESAEEKEKKEKENAKPAVFNGELLNHPLGFNLYNLNWSKKNIKRMKIHYKKIN